VKVKIVTPVHTAKKQNVTVSLDREIVKKAKLLAARRSTSISGMLADQIIALVDSEDSYERAKRGALAALDRGFDMGGGPLPSRDELHER
jgi:hypothetical protein